ncbi:MAG TPA: CYCXC family (seleno)protein, partial [Pyrinomonadaceae bacterium]
LIAVPALVVIVIGVVLAMRSGQHESRPSQTPMRQASVTQQQPPASSHTSHSPTVAAARVPAHFETPPSMASLAPTLAPEQFTGPTREAYRAAREIPQTIAQLPCYCHCDQSAGHKSLHSCFEDDHGAHCAVCVNEALLAYQMEKQMGMTPAQIRQSIIAQHSAAE